MGCTVETQLLAEQVCGALYNENPALGSSVSSAIASATAIAAAAPSKDETQPASYPVCAVSFPLLPIVSSAVSPVR